MENNEFRRLRRSLIQIGTLKIEQWISIILNEIGLQYDISIYMYNINSYRANIPSVEHHANRIFYY